MNLGVSADANETDNEPVHVKPVANKSAALSMEGTIKNTVKTRKVAFLVANGVKDESLNKMKKALEDNGATVKLISLKQGAITTEDGKKVTVDGSFLTDASVLYDAVFIPDGDKNIAALMTGPTSKQFVNEAYMHCKAIATGAGVITDGNADKFIGCIANHRFLNREVL